MMDELQCEGLFKYFPSLLQLKELRLTFIANCSINNFLTYTAVMLNITTIYAICGCFFLGCCGSKCRQVLCRPFSSQIQRDCDSQARCCCSELSLDLQCFRFFNETVVSCWYWEDCSFGYCSYRSRCHRCCVYQGKCNCSTAQESDSVLASTGSSSSQWYQQLSRPNQMYGLCILRIYRVVSVLFSIHYLYRCYSNQWPDYLFKRISYFFRDSGTPQFISKPSNLLLEDETHSTHNREHTAEHILGQKFPITITQQSIVECWELNGKANRGRTNENVIETDRYEGAGTILQLQFSI